MVSPTPNPAPGVGVASDKPNAAIKRHGEKMSDYARWRND